MSRPRKSLEVPVTLEDDAETLRRRVAESAVPEQTTMKPSGVVKAVAMRHDGKFGYEIFDLELPESIVERYCVRRHSPDLKTVALGRAQLVLSGVSQNGFKPKLNGDVLADDMDDA